jgi:hypothetical protein
VSHRILVVHIHGEVSIWNVQNQVCNIILLSCEAQCAITKRFYNLHPSFKNTSNKYRTLLTVYVKKLSLLPNWSFRGWWRYWMPPPPLDWVWSLLLGATWDISCVAVSMHVAGINGNTSICCHMRWIEGGATMTRVGAVYGMLHASRVSSRNIGLARCCQPVEGLIPVKDSEKRMHTL